MESPNEEEPSVLLPEVLDMIFKMTDDLDTRNNCRLACQQWNECMDLAVCDPYVINNYEMARFRGPLYSPFSESTMEFMSPQLRRKRIAFNFKFINLDNTQELWDCKGSLVQSLKLYVCEVKKRNFVQMIQRCINLKSLEITTLPDRGPSVREYLAELPAGICQKVNSICVRNQPSLFGQSSQMVMDNVKTIINNIFRAFPNTQQIKLSDMPIDLASVIYQLAPDLTMFKTEITLIDTLSTVRFNEEVVYNHSRKIPVSFREATIHFGVVKVNTNIANFPDLSRFLSRNPLLDNLTLTGTSDIEDIAVTEEFVLWDFEKCPTLKKLRIRCKKMEPNDPHNCCHNNKMNFYTSFLVKSLPNLTHLDLCNVDHKAYITFCDFLPHLEYLTIKNCIMLDALLQPSDNNLSKLKKLKELTIPPNFIQLENSIMLNKLESLIIAFNRCGCPKKESYNINFNQFNCPEMNHLKIENFKISNSINCQQRKRARKDSIMANLEIISNFPKLKLIEFRGRQYYQGKPTQEDVQAVLKKHQKLVINLTEYNVPQSEPVAEQQ